MKTQKRDSSHRAFLKGYQAGYGGKPRTFCPHIADTYNAIEWQRGWREGREDHWSGYNQFTSHQKVANL